MDRITFTKATEYLAQQLQSGNSIQRVGVVVRAALDTTADVTKRLDELFQTAWDKLNSAMNEKLADFKSDNQRNAMILSYAGSLRTPVKTQLEMLDVGRHSESVTTAAARQYPVPPVPVQKFLANECSNHVSAMMTLANHHDADLQTLGLLASNPEKNVRLSVAANIGSRMRISEPRLTENKSAVYNALLNHYDSAFAPYLVPVCKNEEQLEKMYSETTKTPSNGRLFVDNPFTPTEVLLDISTQASLRLMPGGSKVTEDAKHQIEKRFDALSDVALDLNQ